MAIRNNHWYNLNEQRSYPLDDTASGVSDDGQRFPNSLIQDLRLRWPSDLGDYAFVSSATVTPHLASILIEASPTLSNSPVASTLLAGISIPLADLKPGRTYPLTTFQSGVGGFVTIGSGIDQLYRGLFSSPEQSLITPRAARPDRTPPVPTLGIGQAAKGLAGVVNLAVEAPLELSKETRVIDNIEYEDVLVIRLVEDAANLAGNTNIQDSVFARFAGPCGQRVGSKSCTDPQPIESINGVTPDCDGIITLCFEGCATVARNTEDCGLIIDCSAGLSDTCSPPYLPQLADGKLPSEVPAAVIPPYNPPDPDPIACSQFSASSTTVLSLPLCDTFDNDSTILDLAGGLGFSWFIGEPSDGKDSPGEDYCCQDAATANGCNSQSAPTVVRTLNNRDCSGGSGYCSYSSSGVALFDLDVQTLYRKYTIDCRLTSGGMTNSVIGFIANYKNASSGNSTASGIFSYLSPFYSRFGMAYKSADEPLTYPGGVNDPYMSVGDYIRLQFITYPLFGAGPGGSDWIHAITSVESLEAPGAAPKQYSRNIACDSYGIDSGVCALFYDNCSSSSIDISFFKVEEYVP